MYASARAAGTPRSVAGCATEMLCSARVLAPWTQCGHGLDDGVRSKHHRCLQRLADDCAQVFVPWDCFPLYADLRMKAQTRTRGNDYCSVDRFYGYHPAIGLKALHGFRA